MNSTYRNQIVEIIGKLRTSCDLWQQKLEKQPTEAKIIGFNNFLKKRAEDVNFTITNAYLEIQNYASALEQILSKFDDKYKNEVDFDSKYKEFWNELTSQKLIINLPKPNNLMNVTTEQLYAVPFPKKFIKF